MARQGRGPVLGNVKIGGMKLAEGKSISKKKQGLIVIVMAFILLGMLLAPLILQYREYDLIDGILALVVLFAFITGFRAYSAK